MPVLPSEAYDLQRGSTADDARLAGCRHQTLCHRADAPHRTVPLMPCPPTSRAQRFGLALASLYVARLVVLLLAHEYHAWQ